MERVYNIVALTFDVTFWCNPVFLRLMWDIKLIPETMGVQFCISWILFIRSQASDCEQIDQSKSLDPSRKIGYFMWWN